MKLYRVLMISVTCAFMPVVSWATDSGLKVKIKGPVNLYGNTGNFSQVSGNATGGYSGYAAGGGELNAKSKASITTTTTVGDNTTTGTGEARASTRINGDNITGTTSSGTASISSASGTGEGIGGNAALDVKVRGYFGANP